MKTRISMAAAMWKQLRDQKRGEEENDETENIQH
jgi:hypothetical protein